MFEGHQHHTKLITLGSSEAHWECNLDLRWSLTYCRALSGSKWFAKIINCLQMSQLVGLQLILYFSFVTVQSQNAGFGLPSSFSWLEPYQAQIFQPAPTPTPAKRQSADQSGPSTDPFGMNSFDPLSYMNLDNGNTATQKTQGNKHGKFS